MGIFTIGLLAIGLLGAHGSRWAGITNSRTIAVLLAHDRVEEVRALGYSHWVRETALVSPDPYVESAEVSGIQRVLKIYRDPGPSAPPAIWIEVSCEWTEAGSTSPLSFQLRAWLPALPER